MKIINTVLLINSIIKTPADRFIVVNLPGINDAIY